MYDLLSNIWESVRGFLSPSAVFRKRKLNFITIHYLYILAAVIAGSILIYPAGGMAYIDTIFFTSGASTQSGLNTINVNQINTYQQIILYLIPMFTTPIFIHGTVVFIRLYWFEKRFQGIVRAAREIRRSKSRSRSEAKGERDIGREELGVRGRSIVVLRNNKVAPIDQFDQAKMGNATSQVESGTSSGDGSSNGDARMPSGENARKPSDPAQQPFHRDILFADEIEPADLHDAMRVPDERSPEEHIAFLEKQRNTTKEGTLRIPGPRDFDRGDKPEELNDEDGGPLSRNYTTNIQPPDPALANVDHLNADDHPVRRHIAIDDSNHPIKAAEHAVASPFKFHNKNRPSDEYDGTSTIGRTLSGLRKRAKSGNFMETFSFSKTQKSSEPIPYLSWEPTVGRNSAFLDLTEERREELGGIEYRALKTLAVILVVYYIGFHVLAVSVLLPWIIRSGTYGPIVDGDGVSRTWWGFFSSATLLNDVGFTLTPDSFISFQSAYVPMLFGTFLIIIGNTGFPCMLRFVIWVTSLCVPIGSGVWEELKFLLDHPRRCFTLLFPSKATWILFWILVLLNSIDLIFFIILDLNDPTVTSLSPNIRVLAGWFQAVSTRTAGTASVNIANLHPGIQVSYLIMMYISAFPVAISMRRTNVYEEKSLGVYGSMSEEAADDEEPSYVGAHLRRQLSFDLWYIFLGMFIIACVEGKNIQNTNNYAFTLFSILFEIVSAYGTVGLSLGYPNVDTSFSAQFSVVSKLIIIAMMVRGRHRGLPYELDRAILLPSDALHRKEDEDASRRAMARRNSGLSLGGASRRPSEGRSVRRPSTGDVRDGGAWRPEMSGIREEKRD